MTFRRVGLDELDINDEHSFRHVGLYARLKKRLIADDYRFCVAAAEDSTEDWARVLFLNLTYWNSAQGDDVLAEDAVEADVVAHVAWHHVVGELFKVDDTPASVDALMFGEAVASAFDLYLIGRVLPHSADCDFVDGAIPALTSVALDAGLDEDEVDALFEEVVADPDAAFESLRALLFDVTTALVGCDSAQQAADVLDGVREHRFAPFLHHYELSNWVLHAKLYGGSAEPQPEVRALDAGMRSAAVSLDVLSERTLAPEVLT